MTKKPHSEDSLVSFVIPVVERRGDLSQIYSEYANEAVALGRKAEFIFVVDNRQNEAVAEIEAIEAIADQEIELILLGGKFGESSALMVGLERASGGIVITLASYFQVDPAGLGKALELVEEGADLVVGCRHPRTDSLFNRLQTAVFHRFLNLMTRSKFGDISCGFRAMRSEVAKELNIYGGLHRFIPILATQAGFQVLELQLRQRQEDRATRYYGSALYLKRLLDVLTVFFLMNFTKRPLRFFGLAGLVLTLAGGAVTGYLGIYRLLGYGSIADRPLLLLGVLLMVFGLQSLSIGLIGEIIIFTHARKVRDYRIAEVINLGATPSEGTESSGIDTMESAHLPRA